MPKLPVLSGQEVIDALQRLGFEIARQRGSHVVLRRQSEGTVVPLHREVRLGTLASILRQAGLSTDEFVAALRK
jgi:predicted RNA binding protein YcfA (HicA-like mRNA interferase family)